MEGEPIKQLPHGETADSIEAAPELIPRIYVASLSDYNAGRLHGTWIEAALPIEKVEAAIAGMLMTSPMGRAAEEWAIHDYEGFGVIRLDEHESLQRISKLAQGVVENGLAFSYWAQLVGDEELDSFVDAYLGHWPDLTTYAEDILDDFGLYQAVEQAVPENLRPYVKLDAEGFGRDLVLGGDITGAESEQGGVYVFASQ